MRSGADPRELHALGDALGGSDRSRLRLSSMASPFNCQRVQDTIFRAVQSR